MINYNVNIYLPLEDIGCIIDQVTPLRITRPRNATRVAIMGLRCEELTQPKLEEINNLLGSFEDFDIRLELALDQQKEPSKCQS